MMRFIKFLPIFFVITTIGFIVSCEDENSTNPEDQVPTIPPQSTLIMDFSEFPDTNSTAFSENPSVTKRNWIWAAGNVKYWNSLLTVTLTVPALAFAEAFNHQPVQQADGSWLWQYSISVVNENYNAKLFGKPVTEGVEWKMLLSKEESYTDFEWFTGFSNFGATEGTWTLNKEPGMPLPFLSIEWNRNIQEETADIKYTLISQSILHDGSYIFYGKTNEVPLNRFYRILKAENNNSIDIMWNYESSFGRVKDSVYFEDGNWHCWDERLDDTDCTE